MIRCLCLQSFTESAIPVPADIAGVRAKFAEPESDRPQNDNTRKMKDLENDRSNPRAGKWKIKSFPWTYEPTVCIFQPCDLVLPFRFLHFQSPRWETVKRRLNGYKFAFTFFYRAMHFSAKRGLAIACRLYVCLSVTLVDCDHIGWKSWKLKLHDQHLRCL